MIQTGQQYQRKAWLLRAFKAAGLSMVPDQAQAREDKELTGSHGFTLLKRQNQSFALPNGECGVWGRAPCYRTRFTFIYDFFVLPPVTNRGVTNTRMINMESANLSVIFDWLEFTILNTGLKEVMKIINLDWNNFSKLETGRFGYRNQFKWSGGSIFIMFNTATGEDAAGKIDVDTRINVQSGAHIMITGQGCRQYSAKRDLLALMTRLQALPKVNFSRIDLAIDDFQSKIISYDKIYQAARKGYFTSRWSKWDTIHSRQTSNNEFLGRTMYFGSQASDIFCRVYDKTLERKANSDAESDIPASWTRLEIVYRKDRASKLAEYIVKNQLPLGHALRGTLKQYLRFLTPKKDKNKARWPTAPWWDQLLSNVSKLQLTIKKEAKTIEDMENWVDQQISPTIAAIIKAQEGDLGWLRSILSKGSKRLSQRHKDAIHQYMNRGIAA